MTESEKRFFARIEVPAEDEPGWERRYPGRLRYELDALQFAGITPEVHADSLKIGRVALSFDWPLDATTTVRLRALYPDTFPHTRPEVFLVSGLDPPPVRHRNPMEGNLCLLGRDPRQWTPGCTLYRLLKEQLEDAVRGTGDEDSQGEPAEFWWNSLNEYGSCCFIDSRWDVGDVCEGTLLLRYVNAGTEPTRDGKDKVPVVRAYVEEVRTPDGAVLHQWDGALPADLAQSDKTIRVPWVRVDDTILPDQNVSAKVRDLRETYPWLGRSKTKNCGSKLSMEVFAILYPSELGFGEIGLGWVFFQLYGHPKAFKGDGHPKRRLRVTTLPVYRAGPTDLGYRVPAVELLRQKKILVVGTGAVGAPLALELARNGCGTLHLIEHDIIEPGNTVRWPLGAAAWGLPKLDALAGFLHREYPATSLHTHSLNIGQADPHGTNLPRQDEVISDLVSKVDLVIDASASHGVTSLLSDQCRTAGIPLISLFATPTLEGGAVVLHTKEGGCPNCLEYAWHKGEISPPPGLGTEDNLVQPPGCAERTFLGAGYDLQEISLQAVRLAVDTLSKPERAESQTSILQTLSFVDHDGCRCPPSWKVDRFPKHPECSCRP